MKLLGLDLGSGSVRAAVPEGDTFRILSVPAHGGEADPSAALQAGLATVEGAGPISAAVLTVPVAAEPGTLVRLRQAAQRFGLERVRLVPAPVAAVLASVRRGEVEGAVLVVDVGQSGLSLAVLRVESPRVDVICMDRTAAVSGTALDAVAADLLAELSGAEPSPELARAAARQAAGARHDLTDHFEVRVSLETGTGSRRPVKLSRDQLEQRARPLLMAAEPALRQVLSAAELRPEDLSHVLVVGGCAYVPVVRRFATEVLGRRVRMPEVPETRAAKGAAAYAQSLWGGGVPMCLTPVLPWTVRVAGLDDSPETLLPRGCPLPVRAVLTRPADLPLRLVGQPAEGSAEVTLSEPPVYLSRSAMVPGDRPVTWEITADADALLTARPLDEEARPDAGETSPPLADEAVETRRLPALRRDAAALREALTRRQDTERLATLEAALATGRAGELARVVEALTAWLCACARGTAAGP